MSNARSLIETLPALRRYARAVTSSSTDGDKCIEVLLQGVLSGSTDLTTEIRDPAVEAFRVLDGILTPDGTQIAAPPASAIDRRALLLTAMEEFSHEETAYILEIPRGSVPELLNVAEENLKTSLATKIMIIEDEVLIARHLSNIVSDLGHEVINFAATREEAITKAKENPQSLILADVKLADGSLGSDAAEDIWAMFPDMAIIFITAYPEILLTGRKKEPEFLIPKPFRPEYVQAVVSQALISQADRI